MEKGHSFNQLSMDDRQAFKQMDTANGVDRPDHEFAGADRDHVGLLFPKDALCLSIYECLIISRRPFVIQI
jgi:hypothetical protein